MEQPNETPQKNEQPKQNKDKKKNLGLWISVAINVILIALIAWLWWQLKVCMDNEATIKKDKDQLQSQVTDLKKQLADKGAATADSSACTAKPITQALKDNIKDAINSDNTAALEGYMASSLKVIIAASEFGKTRTPTEAIGDLAYIHDSSGWNFALPAATVNSYLAGPYGTGIPSGSSYFTPTTYFGKASDNKVVAFNFDSCSKINQVFMSATADLLL